MLVRRWIVLQLAQPLLELLEQEPGVGVEQRGGDRVANVGCERDNDGEPVDRDDRAAVFPTLVLQIDRCVIWEAQLGVGGERVDRQPVADAEAAPVAEVSLLATASTHGGDLLAERQLELWEVVRKRVCRPKGRVLVAEHDEALVVGQRGEIVPGFAGVGAVEGVAEFKLMPHRFHPVS